MHHFILASADGDSTW